METAGSVSKGCFVFKGKKKHAKIEDYLPSERNKLSKQCQRTFEQMWEDVDTQVQILQADLNSNIFDELLRFAQESHAGFSLDGNKLQKRREEIPAAALVTGVNTPDHSTMFSNLVAMVKEHVTPLVAILKSKDCPTVKSTLSLLLGQLIDKHCVLHDEDEAGEDVNTKSLPLTLSSLAQWYLAKFSSAGVSSPKKRKAGDGSSTPMKTYPPIVIVMEDLENFVPRVIQDLVTVASSYMKDLPLVFVFGIATSVSAIHRLLPNEVSSLLCMEKFQAPASTEYLSRVISQVLMTDRFPFKVGHGVFQLLLDIFLYHDFSVLNFNQGLRFAMMDHYTSQPLSFLCCQSENVDTAVKAMDSDTVEKLRHLPSFMRYVESCIVKEQPDLLLNEAFTKDRICHLIKAVHEYHAAFFPVLRCLHAMVSKLPGYPLGKQLREVYSLALKSDVTDTVDYQQAKELLKMLSKDEVLSLLHQCSSVLSQERGLENVCKDIESFIQKMDNLDNEQVEVEEDEDDTETSLPSRTSLHQLRQKLQDMSKRQKKLSPFEKFREEVMEYFQDVFKKYLLCPTNLPLHEIFYYNSTRKVRLRLNAAPRSALQMALSNPQFYLQCGCCVTDSGQVKCSMPDTCILYKLHLECGQLINLYDWMQAFITVVQGEDEEVGDEPTQQLQARFIQGVSQLQFLGFVKPTKRKTDHVARLTWGGC